MDDRFALCFKYSCCDGAWWGCKFQVKQYPGRCGRSLAREQRLITRRLENAMVVNTDGPLLGRANISYEYSGRTKALSQGGMGMIARLVTCTGLAEEISSSLSLLKIHHPYFESDHVLNVAYHALCGGRSLDDIEAANTGFK